MKFDDLDAKMRVYEESSDHCVLPGIFMVARIDGRSFTRLTKEKHTFEAPFDRRFRDMMLATTEHLMNCGFSVAYGYTQSDEISLMFHADEISFGRKTRKFNSVLAGEATHDSRCCSADVACFDCRICELPRENDVRDYFRWRQEDAHRNAPSAHCYWLLRRQGQSATSATEGLSGLNVPAKNELLFQNGINFNDLPAWHRRGVGIYWETFEKHAVNKKTGQEVVATRRRLKRDMELPLGRGYDELVLRLLKSRIRQENG